MTTLAQVRAAQPNWFSNYNKRFFGDVAYRVRLGRVSRKPYLIRSTYAWTDMLGKPRRLHYRVNPLDTNLRVGDLVDREFSDIQEVRDWLKGQ